MLALRLLRRPSAPRRDAAGGRGSSRAVPRDRPRSERSASHRRRGGLAPARGHHDLPGRCRQGRRPRDDGRDPTNLKPSTATRSTTSTRCPSAIQPEAQVGPGDVGRSAPDGHDQGARPLPRRRRPDATAALPPDPDRLTITFDLPGGKPRSASPIRVGPGVRRVHGLGVGRPGAGRRPDRPAPQVQRRGPRRCRPTRATSCRPRSNGRPADLRGR